MRFFVLVCRFSILLLLCFGGIGCAGFRHGCLPQNADLPGLEHGARALKAEVNFTLASEDGGGEKKDMAEVTGMARKATEKRIKKKSEKCWEILTDSGYFADLHAGDAADVRIDLELVEVANKMAPFSICGAVISGLTWSGFPCSITTRYRLLADVKRSDGLERNYSLEDGMTFVIWFPMIVASPFKSPFSAEKKIERALYNGLLMEMHLDGFLPTSGAKKGI